MITKFEERSKKLFEKLDKAIAGEDNEVIHQIYDQIIRLKMEQYAGPFLRRLDAKVKSITFWYA